MQVSQLPIQLVTKTNAKSNVGIGNSKSTDKSDFLKLVEQLIGTGNCDNSLPLQNSDLQAGTNKDINANTLPLLSTDSGKQVQTVPSQIMQTSTSSVLSTAIQEPLVRDSSMPKLLQIAKLIINLQQATKDNSDTKVDLLDEKSLKILDILSQAAKQLLKSSGVTDAQPQQTQKATQDKIDEKINIDTNQQQISMQPIISSLIQLNTPLMQSNDMTKSNTQTEAIPQTNTQSISTGFSSSNDVQNLITQPNLINLKSDEFKGIAKDTRPQEAVVQPQPQIMAQAIQGEKAKNNNTSIDAKQEFSTVKFNSNSKFIANDLASNQLPQSNDLQKLFEELNVKSIQSSESNKVPQTQPLDIKSSTQALKTIKTLCEKAPVEVNSIIKAAQTNTKDSQQNITVSDVLSLLNSNDVKETQGNKFDMQPTDPKIFKMPSSLAQNMSNLSYNLNSSVHSNELAKNTVMQTGDKAILSSSIDSQNISQQSQNLQPVLNTVVQTNVTEQSLPLVSSITPFQLKFNDKNEIVKTKAEKQADISQSGKLTDILKLSPDDPFYNVQAVYEKNQSNAVKTNSQNSDPAIQDTNKNATSVYGLNNVQAFTLNTTDNPDDLQAKSIVKQTTNAIVDSISKNQSDFKLHLSPEDLGGITIKMVSKNGAISIQIIADNPRTGQLLSGSIGDLNTAIGQHGITLGKSEILHTGYNTNFSTGDFSQQKQQTGQQQSQQQFKQYKQTERSNSWSPIMEGTDFQANIIIPQSVTAIYDNVA